MRSRLSVADPVQSAVRSARDRGHLGGLRTFERNLGLPVVYYPRDESGYLSQIYQARKTAGNKKHAGV